MTRLALVILALFSPGLARAQDAIAFVGVDVVPMDTARVLEGHTVLVRDDRIVAVGPDGEVDVPEDARRIDGAGRYLVPGVADMHVHNWSANEHLLFVANGVTSVRNMWGGPMHLEWRAAAEAGELFGPTVYSTGPIVDGDPPIWPGSTTATNAEEARRVVAEQKAAGWTSIKVYNRLPVDAYDAIFSAAAEAGMRVCGHVPDAVGLGGVLAAGQASIEHLTGYDELNLGIDGADGSIARAVARRRLDTWVARTVDAGTWNCVTIVVMDHIARLGEREAFEARPEMRYVSPATRASWNPERDFRFQEMDEARLASLRDRVASMKVITKALADAGAGILLGTDTPNPYVVPGFSIHDELRLLVEAGLTPYQALRAGTSDAARYLGESEEFGSVTVGLRADLVLCEGNPLDDIAQFERRVGVMVRGEWFPEEELVRRLDELAETYVARAESDPFEGLEALPSEGDRVLEASYRMVYSGADIGVERIGIDRLEDGAVVLHAVSRVPAGFAYDTTLRLVAGERGDGVELEYAYTSGSSTETLRASRGDGRLEYRVGEGEAVEADMPDGELLTPASLAGYYVVARSLFDLGVGGERELAQQSFSFSPALSRERIESVARRRSDRTTGLPDGVASARVLEIESHGPRGLATILLVVAEDGRVVEAEFQLPIGTLRYELVN